MNELVELGNMSELTAENIDSRLTKLRDKKDSWGNELGIVVIDESGDEYDLIEHNGNVCIVERNAVAAVPEHVDGINFEGESEWVEVTPGQINVSA